MDKLKIYGKADLFGSIEMPGAKNAALPILFAAILANGKSYFTNVPRLRDINTTQALLATLGANVV